jgi:glycosyltransferase involved in cell wall biosynthesis
MVAALAGAGHEVKVVTSSQNYASVDLLDERTDPGPSCVERTLILHDIYKAGALWGAVDRKTFVRARMYCHHNASVLASALTKFEPDIVYLFNTLGLGSAGILAVLGQQGYPWVWHLMDTIPWQMAEIRELTPLLPCSMVDGALTLHGEYIACSSGLLREIRSNGLNLSGRSHVVPNWIDVPLSAARSSYYKPGKTLRVCFAGNINRDKGVDYIVAGLSLLKQQNRELDLRVDLFGQGQTQVYEALSMSFGVGGLVNFMGPLARNQLIERYHDYDLMMFPTWAREPFAFSPMEAASKSCVQAFSNDCGNAEWFFHGLDCLKFERSAEGVAELLSQVLDGCFDFDAIARSQSKSLELHFRLETIAKSVISILDAASRRKPRFRKRSPQWSARFSILAENVALSHAN